MHIYCVDKLVPNNYYDFKNTTLCLMFLLSVLVLEHILIYSPTFGMGTFSVAFPIYFPTQTVTPSNQSKMYFLLLLIHLYHLT